MTPWPLPCLVRVWTERDAITAGHEPGFWRGIAYRALTIIAAGMALAYCFGDPL